MSNNLKFDTTKTLKGGAEIIEVNIRLNDECKNGHQDFAITGTIWEKGYSKHDGKEFDVNGKLVSYRFSSGGCIHAEILKHFPKFKMFIDLHLCDYMGNPMYPIANGFYHLSEGFNNTKPESTAFKGEYCEYYRITPAQFDTLSQSKNKVQFYLNLQNLGIQTQWKKQADAAILELEKMTGQKFTIDSKRTQLDAPTPEEIAEEQAGQEIGYYTPEAEQARKEQAAAALIEKLEADRKKELDKINMEYDVKRQVLEIGGEKALDNCIFYNHTQQLAFNWKGYDSISTELINKITSGINLPDGVTIENKNK